MSTDDEIISLPASYESVNDYFMEQGWTDGLPIIPPTPDRVNAMIGSSNVGRFDVIGEIPPNWGSATVEKIAINAVMAGCRPEHFPVLMAAVKAITQPEFNLYAIQATTHPCGILMIINGPIIKSLNVNNSSGVFGPGFVSNAVIGRAMRLILFNVGGGYPGVGDMSSQGSPAKFSFCIGENEDLNPWNPIHVDMGFDLKDSTVTVAAAESPHNINDHTGRSAEEVLTIVAGAMKVTGANNAYTGGQTILLLGPEHAETIVSDGFTKSDVIHWLMKNALIPLNSYTHDTLMERFGAIPEGPVPMVRAESDLLIGVTGGPGKHSSWIPTFGGTTHSVTEKIDLG
ncbi:MAG: hypothetical protein ACJ0KI_07740 [Dehalococcoidia bacterium]